MKIKVLGTGCPKCMKVEENAKKAAEELGIDTEVEHVTDMGRILAYGVMTTPALVIDGKIKCTGRIPEKEEIKGWLER